MRRVGAEGVGGSCSERGKVGEEGEAVVMFEAALDYESDGSSGVLAECLALVGAPTWPPN